MDATGTKASEYEFSSWLTASKREDIDDLIWTIYSANFFSVYLNLLTP